MFVATVIGFSVVLLLSLAFFLAYLMFGLDSSSSVIVDPVED